MSIQCLIVHLFEELIQIWQTVNISFPLPVSFCNALLANGTDRSDGDLLRLGHDFGSSGFDEIRIPQELVQHRVDEGDVLGEVLRSLALIVAFAEK